MEHEAVIRMMGSRLFFRSGFPTFFALLLGPVSSSAVDVSLESGGFKRGFARAENVLEGDEMVTIIADFDGDGHNELLKSEQQAAGEIRSQLIAFEITSSGFPAVWHQASPHQQYLQPGWHEDFDEDGADDFTVGIIDERGHRLEVRSFDQRVLLRFQPFPQLSSPPFDGRIHAGPCYDINADGRVDLLVSIDAGFSADPREIVAVDGTDGSVLWSTSIACMVLGNMVVLPGCHEGGNPKILVGGWGVGNGAQTGDLDDWHAWKILLDLDGRILEADSLAGEHASVVFGRATDHRLFTSPPYLTIGGTGVPEWARYGLYRLDLCGQIDRHVPLPGLTGGLWLTQLREDPEFEVLHRMGDEPVFDLFSHELERKQTYRLDRPVPRSWVCDLVGDSRDEIILGSASGEIFIFDPEFKPLAYLDTEMEIPDEFWLIERDEMGAMFALTDSRRVITVRTGLLPQRFPFGIAAAGGLAVALGAGLFVAQRNRARRRQTLLVTELTVALRALTVFGHGEPGRVISRTAMLLGSATEERMGQARWREAVEEAVGGFQREVPGALEVIWQNLAALPGTDLPWKRVERSASETVEEFNRLKRDVDEGCYPEPEMLVGAAERLRSIDRRLLDLRRLIRARFRCPVSGAVREVVARLQQGPDSQGISFSVSLRSPEDRLHARIEPNRLRREVVEELVANAILAQSSPEAGWVEIRLIRDGEVVVIEVEDGGPGVRPDLSTRIFQRGVSTKSEGGGFGLYQARRTMEEFGGGITYQQAASGGALFRVTIPATEPPVPLTTKTDGEDNG